MVFILKKGATPQEMQALREKMQQRSKKNGVDLTKFACILKLKEDPLAIQKKMRDEWN